MSVNKVNQTTGELSPIAGGTLYADAPVGSIQAYGGATAPWGWLLCQGQAISRTTYAELFGVIGTSFGAGDGSTTFNVPDLRGEFLRGAGTNSHSGQGSGGAVGAHQDATAVPFISGRDSGTEIITEITVPANNESIRTVVLNSDGDFKRTTNSIFGAYSVARSNTNGNQEQYVRPTNTSVNFIIKATSIALPSDFEAAVDDKIADNIVDSITDGNMKAATSNAIYDAFKAKRNDYTITVPTGWTSEAYLRRQNDTLYLTGSVYTTGTGITNGARLTMENFFPSNCMPNLRAAYYLPVSISYGNVLTNGITCYVNGGRNLYLDNNSGITVKQIYFNIVALCA